MFSKDKKFLIRSSGHILGPFFKDEVIELIKKGKISVFDEVAEPYTIWLYLQDHADFKNIVQSVNMQARLVNFLSSVSTKVSQLSKNTDSKKRGLTVEKTVTETKTEKQPLSSLEKQSASEVSIESVKPVLSASASQSKYQSEIDSEEVIRKKVTFFVSWLWRLIIVGVLSVGAYIFYKEFYEPMKQKQMTKDNLKSKGFIFYTAGSFKKALPFFEQAYSNNILNDNEKILYASLLVQEDKIPKALVVKNELLNSPAFKQERGILLDSLLAYYQKDKAHFTKQLESFVKNSQNKELTDTAFLNLALFYWENQNYQKSISYLDKLLVRGFDREIVFYLKALNLLFQEKTDELEDYIKNLFHQNFITEFKQELYFLSAYIYMKKQQEQQLKQDNKGLDSQIIKLLNEDPLLYQEYSYNSFTIKNTLFNWSYFDRRCQEIFNYDSSNNLFKALYGFCHLKANNPKYASDYIKQAKNAEPKNPLFLALDSYLTMIENKNSFQTEQTLSSIEYEKINSSLPFIIKARFLEKQEEWENALLTWKQLLSVKPYHLSGTAETAFINYLLGNNAIGDQYAKKTFEKYRYYTKLLPYKQ